MRVYFTFRPLRINKTLITPKQLFNDGFSGLNIEYDFVVWDQARDGRVLAYFEFSEDQDPDVAADQKLAILEALQAFACHEKTLESAKAFYDYMTNTTTSYIDGEQLIVP